MLSNISEKTYNLIDDNNLKNLKWITHYNQSPIDEVNQLIKNIDIIKKDQKIILRLS